jgi:type II secretory pathway pseudopilin PulG
MKGAYMAMGRRQSGLGMIEVLIAGVVLAVAVVGTTALMVEWVRSLSDANVRSDSLSYANQCLESARFQVDACASADTMPSVRVDVERDYAVTNGLAGALLEVNTLWQDPFDDAIERRMQVRTRVPADSQIVRPSQLVQALAITLPPPADEPAAADPDAPVDGAGDTPAKDETPPPPWIATVQVVGITRRGDGEFAVSAEPGCSGNYSNKNGNYGWRCELSMPAGETLGMSLRISPDKNYCAEGDGGPTPRGSAFSAAVVLSRDVPAAVLTIEFTEGDADERHGCVNGPQLTRS